MRMREGAQRDWRHLERANTVANSASFCSPCGTCMTHLQPFNHRSCVLRAHLLLILSHTLTKMRTLKVRYGGVLHLPWLASLLTVVPESHKSNSKASSPALAAC